MDGSFFYLACIFSEMLKVRYRYQVKNSKYPQNEKLSGFLLKIHGVFNPEVL